MPTFQPSVYSQLNPRDEDGVFVLNNPEATLAPQKKSKGTGPGTVLRIGAITLPVAAAISYSRNKSIKWAFLSSLVATPYLVYIGIQAMSGKPVLTLE